MKLDLNNSGAWKNVIDFPADNIGVVRAAARSLVKASEPGPLKFRLVDDASKVIAYLDKTDCEWRDA